MDLSGNNSNDNTNYNTSTNSNSSNDSTFIEKYGSSEAQDSSILYLKNGQRRLTIWTKTGYPQRNIVKDIPAMGGN